MQTNDQSDAATFEQLTAARPRIIAELGKAIVGQHEVIEQILIALFAGGTVSSPARRGSRRRCS